MKKEENGMTKFYHKNIFRIGIFLLISILMELFLFNYRYWQSFSNEPVKPTEVYYGSGLERQEDGSYKVISEEDRAFEFIVDEQNVDTVFINVDIVNGEYNKDIPITVYIAMLDDSHAEYYAPQDQQICLNQETSKYFNLHLYGNCHKLKITPVLGVGREFSFDYQLNTRIPMFFSVGRLLTIFAVFLFAYLFRPSSLIYKMKYLANKEFERWLIIGFCVIHVILLGMLIKVNPFFRTEQTDNNKEYQWLAESMKEGDFYLQTPPPQALIDMKNPYDFGERMRVMKETEQYSLWDYAYYEGKYYVYFGVVPCALFYLPFYSLTGTHIHNYVVIYIALVMMLAAILGILSQIIRKWFPKTSVGAWFLLAELTILSSSMITMCKRPDIYTVPISLGWAFALMGLWCFMMADKEGILKIRMIALGSLFFALIAGCRPQLFIIVIPALFILRKYVFSFSYLRSKQGVKSILAFAIPMAVVAALLMYYNYARFHNPFDFGANYNLTFNDMRNRGFEIERIPTGIFLYLFAPPRFEAVFPYVSRTIFYPLYIGETIAESVYGGAFTTNLFFLIPFLPLLLWRKHKKKPIIVLTILFLLCALCTVIVDTEMSGLLFRYFNDFSFYLAIAAILGWLLIYNQVKTKDAKKLLRLFLLVSFFTVFVYQFMLLFVDTGEALVDQRPDLFQAVKYQVMFWL